MPRSTRAGTASVDGRLWRQWGVFSALLALFSYLAWTHRWITDDGYIYLRVVRQLEAGNGPVFNAGQRVEAFTSPLWVAVLWLADVVTPVRIEWLAVGLGILFSLLGIALAIAGAKLLVSRDDPRAFPIPVGAALLIAYLPMWYFATSGLETGMVFAWLGACLWVIAGWASAAGRRMRAGGAILLGLGWLVRPELAVHSALFVLLVIVGQWRLESWSGRARTLALMIGMPLGYQIFRMGYYASLVANTAIAKEGSRARWDLGWLYLEDFASPYWLWLPLAALVFGAFIPLITALERAGENRSMCVVGAFGLAGALNALYVVMVGGDYIHARLLLPALFSVCAPVAVLPLSRRYLGALLVLPWAVVCGVELRPPELSGELLTAERPFTLPANMTESITVEQQGWGEGGRSRKWYTGPAIYHLENPFSFNLRRLNVSAAPGLHLPTVMLSGIGVPSLAMGIDFDVVDMLGLADAFGAHLELEHRGFTGHEKALPMPWVAARLTAAGTRPPSSEFPSTAGLVSLIPSTGGAAFDQQVAWARAASRCPGIAELEQATRAPLTIGQFLANIAHSFELTRLRIPPDPEAAYRRFCGAGIPPEVSALR